MPRIKTYNEFVNENKDSAINEVVDPITLAFALGAIGIAFAGNIKTMYTNRKIAKADLSDLKKLLARETASFKKHTRDRNDHAASEAQENIDNIQSRIDSLSDEHDEHNKSIKSYEKDKSIKSDLYDELMALDDKTREAVLKAAKKDVKLLK